MANLILKPSTGGVLKIQNQDGTVDALSVSTGGNLTAAGTLGVTGAVTASSTLGVTGNTTLSGSANNLGTVTAGNLTNSALTWPTGHVIQTVTKNDHQGTTTMTGQTWTPTQNTCAITPIKTSSKILVQFSIPLSVCINASFTDGGGAVAIFRDINGGGYPAVGSPTYEFNDGSTEINAYLHMGILSTIGQVTFKNHYSWLDSPTHNATEVTYKLYLKQWSTRHNFNSNEWSSETNWILQEIAQ